MEKFSHRLVRGVKWGLAYAGVCAVVGGVSIASTRSQVGHELHMGWWQLVAAYLGSGLVGGVTFGALMPLGRSIVGAGLLGLLVGLPAFFLLTLVIVPGVSPAAGKFLFVWLGQTLWLGPAVGIGLRLQRNQRLGPGR